MNLGSVLSHFSTGAATVTRFAASVYGSDGRAPTPSTSTISIKAVIIPLTGRELVNLPEGMRTNDNRWLYTTTELYTSTQGSHEADMVSVDGSQYQVIKKLEYSVLGGYWQYLVQQTGD